MASRGTNVLVLLLISAAAVSAQSSSQAQVRPATIAPLNIADIKAQHRRSLLSFNQGSSSGSSSVRRLDNSDAFWVFGSNGVHIVDTSGKLLHSISKDSLCKSREVCPTGVSSGGQGCRVTNDCDWGDAKTDGTDYVFATNTAEDKVVVFDMLTGILVAMVPTCGYPYYIDTAEWRDEVYVHCWRPDADDAGSVDVFSTTTWGLNYPLAQASFDMKSQTHGWITLDMATPGYAYSTNLNDAGVHKLDINNRSAVSFINLTSVGCGACGPMAVSGANLHGYVQCYTPDLRSTFLVELDLTTDKVVYKHSDVSGPPQVSPNGGMVVVLNAAQDRVHTLKVGASAQRADDAALQDILPGFKKGGLSRLTFVQSATGDNMAVLTSTADNFVQVLNLDTFALTTLGLPVPDDGNSSSTEGHGAAREVSAGLSKADGKMYALISGSRMKWLHTATLGAKAAPGEVKLMDTLSNVVGKRLVWVPKTTTESPAAAAQAAASGTSSSSSSNNNNNGDGYKSVAIAGLVLGCVSMLVALALVAHRVVYGPGTAMSAGAGGSGCVGGGCVDPAMAYVPHVDQELGGMNGGVAKKF